MSNQGSQIQLRPAPTVATSTPETGPAAGGTAITLVGTGFTGNNAGTNNPTIAGASCTSVVAVSNTQITCVTPAGVAGGRVLRVINSNGTSNSIVFTYT
jgi:hypothetical protein